MTLRIKNPTPIPDPPPGSTGIWTKVIVPLDGVLDLVGLPEILDEVILRPLDLVTENPFPEGYIVSGSSVIGETWREFSVDVGKELINRVIDLKRRVLSVETEVQFRDNVLWNLDTLGDRVSEYHAYRMMYELHEKGWCPSPLFTFKVRRHLDLLRSTPPPSFRRFPEHTNTYETEVYRAMKRNNLTHPEDFRRAHTLIQIVGLHWSFFIDAGEPPRKSNHQKKTWETVESYRNQRRRLLGLVPDQTSLLKYEPLPARIEMSPGDIEAISSIYVPSYQSHLPTSKVWTIQGRTTWVYGRSHWSGEDGQSHTAALCRELIPIEDPQPDPGKYPGRWGVRSGREIVVGGRPMRVGLNFEIFPEGVRRHPLDTLPVETDGMLEEQRSQESPEDPGETPEPLHPLFIPEDELSLGTSPGSQDRLRWIEGEILKTIPPRLREDLQGNMGTLLEIIDTIRRLSEGIRLEMVDRDEATTAINKNISSLGGFLRSWSDDFTGEEKELITKRVQVLLTFPLSKIEEGPDLYPQENVVEEETQENVVEEDDLVKSEGVLDRGESPAVSTAVESRGVSHERSTPVDPLTVRCPYCKQEPGHPCQAKGGGPTYPHKRRQDLSESPPDNPLRVRCPHCGSPPGVRCQRPSGHSGNFVGLHRKRIQLVEAKSTIGGT